MESLQLASSETMDSAQDQAVDAPQGNHTESPDGDRALSVGALLLGLAAGFLAALIRPRSWKS